MAQQANVMSVLQSHTKEIRDLKVAFMVQVTQNDIASILESQAREMRELKKKLQLTAAVIQS